VGVVVACYTEERWTSMLRVIAAIAEQTLRPEAVVFVVDHNETLHRRLTAAVPGDVTVLRNEESPGAGGSRNTGVSALATDLVAFLDDDAVPAADWLEQLAAHMRDQTIIGAGGGVEADWSSAEPRWFPRECGWVVGRRDGSGAVRVRNVWSASMIVDRAAFSEAGGFRAEFGKVGSASEPEDTDLCLRLTHATGRGWLFEPRARVYHRVSSERANIRFFFRRCWMEGRGKASLRARSDRSLPILDEEVAFVTRLLPSALAEHLRTALGGDLMALARAGLLLGGTATTCLGFVCSLPRFSRGR
jgi:GT2 family glycosyltransferase